MEIVAEQNRNDHWLLALTLPVGGGQTSRKIMIDEGQRTEVKEKALVFVPHISRLEHTIFHLNNGMTSVFTK